MLYILNKTSTEAIEQFSVICAGDDDASVLFIGDAVFLATEANLKRFASLKIDSFYAAKDAVEARAMETDADVELVDYDDMAGLLEDFDKIITL